MAKLDKFTLNILCNSEVIDINQDALGKQAQPIVKDAKTLILAKPMEDGSLAVGLFSLAENRREVTIHWEELGIRGFQRVRDVWRQKDMGVMDEAYSVQIARHGVMLVRLWPTDK
jgi:alpha-galactosidase